MRFVFAALLAGLLPVAAMAASSTPNPAASTTPNPAVAPAPNAAAPTEATEPVDPTKAQIHVTVDNVETDEGAVRVALCNKALSQDGCQFFESVPAEIGSVSVTFENIAPGPWAVAAFQDKNGSGEMDKNFIGLPLEPYALSNDATSHMIPTLKDALVKMAAGANEVHLKLGSFMKK